MSHDNSENLTFLQVRLPLIKPHTSQAPLDISLTCDNFSKGLRGIGSTLNNRHDATNYQTSQPNDSESLT